MTDLNTRLAVVEENSGGASNNHTHGTITLSGDVSGSGTIGSGTTAINITTVVANNSDTHTSSNISDSISAASGITASASGLVQGKAVYGMVSTVETKLNDRIDTLVTDIEDNEYVTALAITVIESRMTNMENITKDNEYVTALALTELERRITELQATLANVTAQLANTLTVE